MVPVPAQGYCGAVLGTMLLPGWAPKCPVERSPDRGSVDFVLLALWIALCCISFQKNGRALGSGHLRQQCLLWRSFLCPQRHCHHPTVSSAAPRACRDGGVLYLSSGQARIVGSKLEGSQVCRQCLAFSSNSMREAGLFVSCWALPCCEAHSPLPDNLVPL